MVASFFLLQQPTVLLPIESHHSSLINSCSEAPPGQEPAPLGWCAGAVHNDSETKLSLFGAHFWHGQMCTKFPRRHSAKCLCPTNTLGLVWSVIPGSEVLHRFRHFHPTPQKITIRQRKNITIVLYVSHLISRCAAVGMSDGYSCSDCVYILIWSNHHKTKEKEPCHRSISLLLQLVFERFLFSGLTGDYPAAVTDSWKCRRLQNCQGKPQKIQPTAASRLISVLLWQGINMAPLSGMSWKTKTGSLGFEYHRNTEC